MMNIPHISDIEQSFKSFLDSIGHPLIDEMKFDTQNWARYDCPLASRGNKNVSYRAHTDGLPCLKVQCHKCYPEPIICKYDKPFEITPEQRQSMRYAANKRKEDEANDRAKALNEIRKIWANAKPCMGHKYFERKGLNITETDGLKIDTTGRVLCPIRLINGELISLQTIPFQGKKLFHAHTSPKYGFHIFGSIEDHDTIFFAEGVATSLTVKDCVNRPVICVYGKHFSDIAPIIKNAYPNKRFFYCCDLPSRNEKFTSEDDARKAIALVGGNTYLPDFSIIGSDIAPEIPRSDINDLFMLLLMNGLDRAAALDQVRQQI